VRTGKTKTESLRMRTVCWACCGILAISALTIAVFIVWAIAATSPLWKAEDAGSANSMLPFCKLKPAQLFFNPTAAYLHGRCIGVLDNTLLMTEMLARQDPSLCARIPVGTTIGQVRDAVVKYAEEHPDQTNSDFRRFAYNAVHDTWPCK
jgi:Rap1a immunity proteins